MIAVVRSLAGAGTRSLVDSPAARTAPARVGRPRSVSRNRRRGAAPGKKAHVRVLDDVGGASAGTRRAPRADRPPRSTPRPSGTSPTRASLAARLLQAREVDDHGDGGGRPERARSASAAARSTSTRLRARRGAHARLSRSPTRGRREQVQEGRRDRRPERDGEAEDDRQRSATSSSLPVRRASRPAARTATAKRSTSSAVCSTPSPGSPENEGRSPRSPSASAVSCRPLPARRNPSLVSTRPSPAATTAAPPSSSCSSDVPRRRRPQEPGERPDGERRVDVARIPRRIGSGVARVHGAAGEQRRGEPHYDSLRHCRPPRSHAFGVIPSSLPRPLESARLFATLAARPEIAHAAPGRRAPSGDRLAGDPRVVELVDEVAAPAAGIGARAPAGDSRRAADGGGLAFVPSPNGYTLVSPGLPARPGDVLELDGAPSASSGYAPSPLPGDRRRCAVVARRNLPEPDRTLGGERGEPDRRDAGGAARRSRAGRAGPAAVDRERLGLIEPPVDDLAPDP